MVKYLEIGDIKMRKIVLFAALAIVSFCLSACVIVKKSDTISGEMITKNYEQVDFQKVQLACPADLYFSLSDSFSVRVECDKTYMENLEVYVKNKTLHIEEKNQFSRQVFFGKDNNSDFKVYVSAPSLAGVAVAGSGLFECQDNVSAEKFSAQVAGSGDIKLRSVQCIDFDTSVAGSGMVELDTLQAKNASISIAGSGDVRLNARKVEKTKASIAGSGDIDIHFEDCGTASISIAGSGDVALSGTLKTLNQNVRGSGDIRTKNLKLTGEG